MHRNPSARLCCTVLLSAVLALTVSDAAPDLYPDPGFEGSGEPGNARTGERAGHLEVDAANHWAALGGQLEVEPFARYRVTEWYQARVGRGTFYAPYCYDWDSYEWAFVSAKTVPTTAEWTRSEATFVSPNSTMYVHPLAYIDAENSEGWVDDIVVEKIAEPAQVMAELKAKAAPSEDERRLLGRWCVQQGKVDAARRLMESADGLLRADLATVLARATKDPAQRRPYLVQVAAYGGPTYYQGMQRFGELTADMTAAEKVAVAAEAVQLNPGFDRCAQAARLIITGNVGAGSLATVAEGRAQIRAQRQALDQVLTELPAGSAAAKELLSAMTSLTHSSENLRARQATLGHCRVTLGGQVLDPHTHAIVVPDKATPQEEYAARDLRYHLELVTGREFPIKAEREAGKEPGLFVGKTKLAAAAGVRCDDRGLEGIHLKTVGHSLVLAGNQRGVLYAVYTFLENNLGCRWFTPDCATWPKSGQIKVAALDRRYIPPLEFRAGDYPIARPGAFAVRCRLNGNNHQLDTAQGGRKGVHSLAHTFAALVPPERYFKDHPEYFSLVGGKRQSGYAQLCLTNPDVLKTAIAGVRQWITSMPDMKVFSVSQNDTANYCECDNCRKVAEEEGSQAGPVLRFVNAIADDIAKDSPDVAIETLAYQYTRKPPKLTKPRPNVVICLCSIECCFIHPLGTDPFNKTFVDDIKGWHQICDRLWIWDYIINYAHSICPFPNLYVLKPNIDFFIANGVKGIYEESCYFTKGSELQELRNYIIAKTLWDPTYDTDKAIDEFCAAFYGPAAKPVRDYLNLIHRDTQQDPNLHVQIFTHPKSYIKPEMIAEATRILDQAEAAVKDSPTFLHRVQVARLPLMYAAITPATSGSYVERDGALVMEGGTDGTGLAARFAEIARAEGVTMVSEGGGFEGWLAGVPKATNRTQIEHLGNPALSLDLLPGLGGRIWRMKTAAGRDLIKVFGDPNAYVPTEGGYEEYSGSGYRSPGWREPYKVIGRSDRFVAMEANLSSGLRFTRRVALDAVKPLVTITSTLLNTTNQTQTACLRVHPEFAVRDLAKSTAKVLGADNTWRTITLANPADPQAERDEFLREADLPNGAWAVVDAGADLAIVNSFGKGQVAQALLNRSGKQSRVNLELYSPEVQLTPGKTLTLEHTYEVVATGDVR